MEHRLVDRVGEAAERAALLVARILEQGERLVGVRRDDDLVEAPHLVSDAELDPFGIPADPAHRASEPHRPSQALSDRLDVLAAAAGRRPPAKATETEHPVVVEEPDRVR